MDETANTPPASETHDGAKPKRKALRRVLIASQVVLGVGVGLFITERVFAARDEGLLLCPEGAATLAAYRQSVRDGRVGPDERCVLFNCATGLKYPMPPVERYLDRHGAIDYDTMA